MQYLKRAGKIMRWLGRFLFLLILLLLLFIAVLGFRAVPVDEQFEVSDYGVGANSIMPSNTGLERAFPTLNELEGHSATEESVELGRLLFFDPVLSENNDLACASCHHPDLGFSDGQAVAIGADGRSLERNSMSLWNVGYTRNLFWDGRAGSLEEQAQVPLTHLDEMAVADTNALEAELSAIPEYSELFATAFPDGVSFENITVALADFQRTLLSQNSPFDSYAAGDTEALTPSQRRGLTLFRSAATRCFECHSTPTFSTETFRKIGVTSEDDGAGNGTFKVPSLRNVALSAPYMHNGSLPTLESVVEFYANGGGRANGVEDMDPFVLGFDLNTQEKQDLVNFLYALTDESQLPEVPSTVPSGLTIVDRQVSEARAVALSLNRVAGEFEAGEHIPTTISVAEGETVQSAVDRAMSGDTIEIPYGTYFERVVVDQNNITLRGIPNENGDLPIFDGRKELSEAVISSGNAFVVSHLQVQNYVNNGILVEGVTGIHMHDNIVKDTGIYGLYPVQSTDVLIENNVISGANDAGVYAGQSERVVIRGNEVFANVLGIEAENTLDVEIYDNNAYDNTLGILVVLLPNLTSKISKETIVRDNIVKDNNHVNFGTFGLAAGVAPGIGIAVIGSDEVEVMNNDISGNKTVGVTVMHSSITIDESSINVPSTPENVYVHSNNFDNNGYDPDPSIKDLGLPGADIIWDVSGENVRFDETGASSFPPVLPSGGLPKFFYNVYWNGLQMVIRLLG